MVKSLASYKMSLAVPQTNHSVWIKNPNGPPITYSKHFLMQIGPDVVMIIGLQVDFVFILEIILFLGVARNKQLWHVQALKLNINPWPTLLLNSHA
jgi:hypothetical protein